MKARFLGELFADRLTALITAPTIPKLLFGLPPPLLLPRVRSSLAAVTAVEVAAAVFRTLLDLD